MLNSTRHNLHKQSEPTYLQVSFDLQLLWDSGVKGSYFQGRWAAEEEQEGRMWGKVQLYGNKGKNLVIEVVILPILVYTAPTYSVEFLGYELCFICWHCICDFQQIHFLVIWFSHVEN